MQRVKSKQEPGQDTRGRVLRAAEELFASRGYAGTSISAIRDASGVLPSSIYWEFGNKEGVFAAVLEDSTQRWLRESSGAIARLMHERLGRGDNDLIAAYFEYMAEALAERPEGLRLMLCVSVERRDTEENSLEIIRRARERALMGLSRLFAATGLVSADGDSLEARDAARLAMACFDGAVVAAGIEGDASDFRRIFRLLRTGIEAASHR